MADSYRLLAAKLNRTPNGFPSTSSGCQVCATERCPVHAIQFTNGSGAVSKDRCIGCGVCIASCPTESIKLLRRPQAEQLVPSRDIMNWSLERASSRVGPLTRVALRAFMAWRGR
jgi:Fe-S-cluster-containing hydrogenase component 2